MHHLFTYFPILNVELFLASEKQVLQLIGLLLKKKTTKQDVFSKYKIQCAEWLQLVSQLLKGTDPIFTDFQLELDP